MLKYLAAMLVLLFASACSTTRFDSAEVVEVAEKSRTVVYLVRHAEKNNTNTKDPELSEAGQNRAKVLAELLADVELDKIYSTNYIRTKMTATPTAKSKKLEITSYAVPAKLLAARILKLHKLEKVLVVDHSNTIPELISALGIETPIVIEHHQYGDLFIVELDAGKPQLTWSKFGK